MIQWNQYKYFSSNYSNIVNHVGVCDHGVSHSVKTTDSFILIESRAELFILKPKATKY